MSIDNLIRNTSAYKIVKGDKVSGTLSHAYLLICGDGVMLRQYLGIFAKLFMCSFSEDYCGECRICRLIDKEKYADCLFYPEEGKSILVDDVDNLISETYIKPYEDVKRLFVISGAETMNAVAQNKLLKTLEEPPKNVYILIGASSEYPLLSTIKSRTKKLEIPQFSEKILLKELSGEYSDRKKLISAASLCDGKIGRLKEIYDSDSARQTEKLCMDILLNMKSSKQVVDYTEKINKENIADFCAGLKLVLRDVLVYKSSGEKFVFNKDFIKDLSEISTCYCEGALISITEKLGKAEKDLKFNGNANMIADSVLFGILEERYKWQKL